MRTTLGFDVAKTAEQDFQQRMKMRTPLCYNRWSADWQYNWRRWLWVTMIHVFFCGFDYPHKRGRLIKDPDF